MSTTPRERHPGDLTEFRWENVSHPFPGAMGRPADLNTYPPRGPVDDVLYLARCGCPWRRLPHHFPPWKRVPYNFSTRRGDGVA